MLGPCYACCVDVAARLRERSAVEARKEQKTLSMLSAAAKAGSATSAL